MSVAENGKQTGMENMIDQWQTVRNGRTILLWQTRKAHVHVLSAKWELHCHSSTANLCVETSWRTGSPIYRKLGAPYIGYAVEKEEEEHILVEFLLQVSFLVMWFHGPDSLTITLWKSKHFSVSQFPLCIRFGCS